MDQSHLRYGGKVTVASGDLYDENGIDHTTDIGIPAGKQNLVFERLRQIGESDYREGTGLGLSISKGIIELLGGQIWLTSSENKGTTFTFSVPYLAGKK